MTQQSASDISCARPEGELIPLTFRAATETRYKFSTESEWHPTNCRSSRDRLNWDIEIFQSFLQLDQFPTIYYRMFRTRIEQLRREDIAKFDFQITDQSWDFWPFQAFLREYQNRHEEFFPDMGYYDIYLKMVAHYSEDLKQASPELAKVFMNMRENTIRFTRNRLEADTWSSLGVPSEENGNEAISP
jgi:hypothetical protein